MHSELSANMQCLPLPVVLITAAHPHNLACVAGARAFSVGADLPLEAPRGALLVRSGVHVPGHLPRPGHAAARRVPARSQALIGWIGQ